MTAALATRPAAAPHGRKSSGLTRTVWIVLGGEDHSDLVRAQVVRETRDDVLVRVGADGVYLVQKHHPTIRMFRRLEPAVKAHRRNLLARLNWMRGEVRRIAADLRNPDPAVTAERVFGTVGRLVAERLGLTKADLDQLASAG